MAAQDSVDISHLEQQLSEAATHAEQGNYEAAVKAVRAAKSLAPRNVYVLAFERQAEQLSELHSSRALTEEARTDILESIPSIIERALESTRSPGSATDISTLKAGDASQEKKEKAAALEWLKNQYFQHAHEYIRKGQYDHALAEIRRVYIIDPGNSIARDFEKQFEALAQMKRGDPARTAAAAAPPTIAIVVPPAGSPPPEADSTPMMTEEWSSPQQLLREGPRPARAPEKPAPKPQSNALLITLIIIALCVLGALLYYYYQRNIYKKPAVTSLPSPAAEQFIGAPAQADEQNFLVTQDDSPSGTPQVTEVTSHTEAPPAATRAAARNTPGKDIARAEKSAPPPQTVERPPLQETQPPLMATQPQPVQKESPAPPKTEDTAAPAPFVAVEKQARIIRLEKPRISTEGFIGGVSGQVVVQVRIDATGKPVQTVTLKSTNDMLIQPVIDAVMASQFAPAEMTTGPVASWLTIPFRFATR